MWRVPGNESGITWNSIKSLKQRSRHGTGRTWEFSTRYTSEEALDRMSKMPLAQRYFEPIGAVMMWRNITTEQIADLLEHKGQGESVRIWMPAYAVPGFTLNAIQVGRPTDYARPPIIFRPGHPMDKRLVQMMTWQQHLGIFGSNNDGSHGGYARHNILNTELSLRVAEQLDAQVPIVLGEGLGSSKILVPETAKRSKQFSLGDSVWIRKDGLRIIVEVSNTASAITGKVTRWANSLATDQAGMRSLALVFVIPGQTRDPHWTNYIRDELADVIYKELGGRGYDAAYIASRVFVVGWESWFPAQHEMSDDFFSLETIPISRQLSASVSLLDPFALPSDVPEALVARTINNSKYLYGVPKHMRRDVQPLDNLKEMALREAQASADRQKQKSNSSWRKLDQTLNLSDR
jgi:hypothetical protein